MDLSFVFPCLNEEETLAYCINELKESLSKTTLTYEVIVADNGSTDASREIALKSGARVVNVLQKGYGAALRGGFAAAEGKYIAFADADGSYPIGKHIYAMFNCAEERNADMVIASRIKGVIEDGAMPFLHRHLGTPVLTCLINLLFKGKLSDCNSGFRLMRKDAYSKWNVTSEGMEFASELLIKSLKNNANIVEINGGLSKDKRSRSPHLKTWRDGMRHLLFILSEKPSIFETAGMVLTLLATLLQFLAVAIGPVNFGGVDIFHIHTNLILFVLTVFGIQIYLFSCYLYTACKEKTKYNMTAYLIHLDEANVFFGLLIIAFIELLVLFSIAILWINLGFSNLGTRITSSIIIAFQLLVTFGLLAFGILGIHILKRKSR